MPLSEFDIISRYFGQQTVQRDDVKLGIGDDCALLQPRSDEQLAVSMDTLVSGVHFSEQTSAFDIGHKALAVNLSDLAAMGAQPQWATLALTLPNNDNDWLTDFCEGLFQLARQYQVQLVGGDLTRGPLTITIQVHGSVPDNKALRRDGAKAGDGIYVTGHLGDAAVGLALTKMLTPVDAPDIESRDCLLGRLNRPTPRIDIGLALRNIATSAIDISDGLAADLGHILNASHHGARIDVEKLPISEAALRFADKVDIKQMALSGGDDYELCFTAPDAFRSQLKNMSNKVKCPITKIGVIEARAGLRCFDNNTLLDVVSTGFRHF